MHKPPVGGGASGIALFCTLRPAPRLSIALVARLPELAWPQAIMLPSSAGTTSPNSAEPDALRVAAIPIAAGHILPLVIRYAQAY